MARGEDTRDHPARKVSRESLTQTVKLDPSATEPIITEEKTESGSRLRRIGSYTSYVHAPEGGYKAVPPGWRQK